MAPAKKGKRSAREAAIAAVAARGKKGAAVQPPEEKTDEKDELVYEDPYEDEFESESDDAGGEDEGEVRTVEDGAPGSAGLRVFRPGMDSLRPGEQMVHDVTAYEMMHKLNVEWPALSFDILRNNEGQISGKTAYPMKVYVVAGTQADKSNKNKIVVMKMSNLYRTRAKTKPSPGEDDEESDDDDDDDEDNDDADDRGCVLEHQEIKHDGVVNRIRSMPQKEQVVATWSDNSRVYLTDVDACLQALDRGSRMPAPGQPLPSAVRPFYSFGGHTTEGFAMDWSPVEAGRLVTGDCKHDMYLWQMRDGASFQVDPTSFRGHRDSVEDIQWSPSESSVFASCSVDKSVKFWDVRQNKKSAALSVDGAHDTDINVMSWNRIDPHLLVSGCDNGALKVWDLRNVKSAGAKAKPAADFRYHHKAITSVEWHPQESSMLAASSEDNSCSIWDLGVERDPEEEARLGTVLPGAEDIPAQLLFVHLGQEDVKEVHWHPVLRSVLVSTAGDGFNVLRPVDMF